MDVISVPTKKKISVRVKSDQTFNLPWTQFLLEAHVKKSCDTNRVFSLRLGTDDLSGERV